MNAPIRSRTGFYERLKDGTMLDWPFNLVDTSIGPMIEPCTLLTAGGVSQFQAYDSGYTDLRELTAEEAMQKFRFQRANAVYTH